MNEKIVVINYLYIHITIFTPLVITSEILFAITVCITFQESDIFRPGTRQGCHMITVP